MLVTEVFLNQLGTFRVRRSCFKLFLEAMSFVMKKSLFVADCL